MEKGVTVTFFTIIATPGLGTKNDLLKQTEVPYGQGRVSITTNPLNGNLFVKDFEQTFIQPGFPLTLGYSYNSQSATPWKLNQGKIIRSLQGELNQINSQVTVEEADGHESLFCYDIERNCYVNTSDSAGAATLRYADSQWTGWNPANNTSETYANNQLQQVTDNSGNFLTYEYDSLGRITLIGGNSDRKIQMDYSKGKTTIYALTGETKKLIMEYQFDQQNRLTRTRIPELGEVFYEINYTYSGSTGLIESINQTDKTCVTFEYKTVNAVPMISALTSGANNRFNLNYQANRTELIDPFNNSVSLTSYATGLLRRYTNQDQYH